MLTHDRYCTIRELSRRVNDHGSIDHVQGRTTIDTIYSHIRYCKRCNINVNILKKQCECIHKSSHDTCSNMLSLDSVKTSGVFLPVLYTVQSTVSLLVFTIERCSHPPIALSIFYSVVTDSRPHHGGRYWAVDDFLGTLSNC